MFRLHLGKLLQILESIGDDLVSHDGIGNFSHFLQNKDIPGLASTTGLTTCIGTSLAPASAGAGGARAGAERGIFQNSVNSAKSACFRHVVDRFQCVGEVNR